MSSKYEMSIFGIGPSLAVLSIAYCLVMWAITVWLAPMFNMPVIPDTVRLVSGLVLCGIGVPFYIVAVISMARAYRVGKLATTGIFAFCRNPVYAAWIVFIVPGLAFLANSAIGLSAPFMMYALMKALVVKEERYLAEKFGDEYLSYRKNTPDILPIGWFWKSKA